MSQDMVITHEAKCPQRSKCYTPDATDPLGRVHVADKLEAIRGQLRMATIEILRLRGNDREASALEAASYRNRIEAPVWREQMEQGVRSALVAGKSLTQSRNLAAEEDSHGL